MLLDPKNIWVPKSYIVLVANILGRKSVGPSGLRIIKKGGVELIIPKTLPIKNYSFKAFTYVVKRIWSRRET